MAGSEGWGRGCRPACTHGPRRPPYPRQSDPQEYRMIRTRIIGTGSAVPDRVVTNDELSRVMDTSDEWIRTRTGIQERRWVREGETGTGLAQRAAEAALAMANIAAGELDAIVYATCTPDHFIPGNGVYLQRAMG